MNPVLIPVDLGKWILETREKAGLTQEALAAQVGVTKGNVSAWETGRHEPGYRQVLQIHQACGFNNPLPGATTEPVLTRGDLLPAEVALVQMFRAQPSRELRAAVYRLLNTQD